MHTMFFRGRGFLTLAALLCTASLTAQQSAFGSPACTQIPADHAHPTPAEITQIKERAAADPSVLVSAEPMENIGTLRYRIRDYAQCKEDGGCYWADLDAQYQRAAQLLTQTASTRKHGEKLALVLDIDETTLSSYCEMQREDFGFIARSFNDWIVSTDAAVPIQGTLRLVQQAHELGVDLFFITGRPESQRQATERNLHAAGFESWKHLSLRPSSSGQIEHNGSTIEYKSWERKKIAEDGYRIILNVGDQWSDLMGEPMAEHSIKLPNPFYYLP